LLLVDLPLLFSLGRQSLPKHFMKVAKEAPVFIAMWQSILSYTIHIMKAAWGSPMCVFDVAGGPTVYYLHHEGG
jgi:hypothetical protein